MANNMLELNLISINVRGLHDKSKRITLFQWLKDKKYDIICLQETFCTKNFIPNFDRDWQGPVYHSVSDTNHGRGVCIMVRKGFEFKLINKHISDDGRRILLNIDINGNVLCITNIYGPNNENVRCDFLKKVNTWVRQYTSTLDNIIITGDFNTTLSDLDRLRQCKDKSTNIFIKLLKNLSLTDTWRKIHGDKPGYTYGNKSRIDYILISNAITPLILNTSICKVPKIPDHKAVTIKLKKECQNGKGYWKLNTSILEDKLYQNGIQNTIATTITEFTNKVDKRQLWDICKIKIKEFSISYCYLKKRNKYDVIKKLEEDIKNYESKIDVIFNDEEKETLLQNKSKLEKEYDILYEKKAKGAQIRSKSKHIEHGERNTKYFLSLENHNQCNNTIFSLNNTSDETVSDTNSILGVAHDYYKTLYTSKDLDKDNMDKYINEIIPKCLLTDDDALICEGSISSDECETVLKFMSKNKSPGLDGLPTEFYQTFWKDIHNLILDSYNEAFDKNKLSDSHRRAVITLIFKKGKREFLKNYRPISLTNCDYKILAFVLASRLQKVMPMLVSDEQTAYIKKRFIGENIRLLEDIMQYAENNNIPGAFLFLDFEKAFDSLEWEFMFKTLDRLNFGPIFKKWIRILYVEPTALIKINGWLTGEITLTRGIRQGCPISALLFILCTEILAQHIKQDKTLCGFTIKTKQGEQEIKVTQYADDTTLFLKDQWQVVHALSLIRQFSLAAGPNLNIAKTEGMLIGSIKDLVLAIGEIKWSTGPIRYLGIYIGHNLESNYTYNWENKIEKMQKLLDNWRLRDMTIFGKIAIIKSLALPKLIYSASMLAVPTNVIKHVNKMLYNFIWKGRDRICRNTLISSIEKGGISMVDFECMCHALKAAWIPRIIRDIDKTWCFLAKNYLQMYGDNYNILSMSFKHKDMFPGLSKMPIFYQDVLVGYCKSKQPLKPSNKNELANLQLWGNRNLLYKNKCMYNKNWINSGIYCVRDLYNMETGNISFEILYNILHNKSDALSQCGQIQQCMKNYKHLWNTSGSEISENDMLLRNEQHFEFNHEQYIITDQKCKFFYNYLVLQKEQSSYMQNVWEKIFIDNNMYEIDWSSTYNKKIKNIPDKKISEFNYKILNNLLPCQKHLFQWKLSKDPFCMYCNEIQDVKHLLFDCKIIDDIWKIIGQINDINILWKDIVLGNNFCTEINVLVSTIAFCIYKRWLIDSDTKHKDQHQICNNMTLFIIKELSFRGHVYSHTKYIKINNLFSENVDDLNKVVNN